MATISHRIYAKALLGGLVLAGLAVSAPAFQLLTVPSGSSM